MKLLILISLLLSFITTQAQLTIHGYIIDTETKEPIPGATIVEKGKTNGTTSDIDGKYRLAVDSNSVIHFTFIGFKDLLVPAKNLNGETVEMTSEFPGDDIFIPHYSYSRTKSVGFLGDANRMPYGFLFHYFKPYFFRRYFGASLHTWIKTDLKSNSDFLVQLSKHEIINLNSYKLGAIIIFHNRDLLINNEKLHYRDILIKTNNKLYNVINLEAGVNFRQQTKSGIKFDSTGINIGLYRYFRWSLTHLGIAINTFKDQIEYSLSCYQTLSKNNLFLNRLQFGFIYISYHDYKESVISLRYYLD
ncbi:MAG: carboxypeptidase-like regulatory domain-containing protein [Bacteroidales bacterium]|nr:carboxypeptidase-like regulatory domain-containing protein [Bacteroidales bacterium]